MIIGRGFPLAVIEPDAPPLELALQFIMLAVVINLIELCPTVAQ
jgi:hypothetical protein